jgi:hypothetical protein
VHRPARVATSKAYIWLGCPLVNHKLNQADFRYFTQTTRCLSRNLKPTNGRQVAMRL